MTCTDNKHQTIQERRLFARLKLDAILNATIQSVRTIRVPWMTRVAWLTLAFGRQ